MKALLLPFAIGLLLSADAGAQTRAAADASGMSPPQAGTSAPPSTDRRLVRADATGTLGWVGINKSEIDSYNDWLGRSFVAGGAFGWYWTNHWKTSVDGARSNEVSTYTPVQERDASGLPLFGSREYSFQRTRLAVTQQYQFRDNEWFHPFVGAGIEFVAERTVQRDDPLYGPDPVFRQTVIVRPAVIHPAHTDVKTLGSVAGGFKWYFTGRGFFASEARLTFGGRPEEVLLRMGLGIDF